MERQKNIPKLRFSEFEGEWENMELGAIGSTYNGLTGKSRDDFGEGKPYIQYKQIFDDSKIDVTRFEYVRIDTKEKQNRVLFGDVFFTVSSETPNEIGTASVLLDNVDELYLNSFCFGYRSSHQILSPWFARYLFRSELFRNEIVKLAQGSTRYNMSKAALMKLIVGLPTLPEQQKIASFFTAIDQKISQLKRKETLLEQYKKGVMQKIFSQQIKFKSDSGREFPKWEKLHGNEIFETVSNKNHNSDLPILAITQEQGAVPRDMIDYYITVSEQSIESYKVVEKGDFIISLRSFQGGIEYSEYKGICSPAYIILRAIQNIDSRYFKYYFKTTNYISELNRKLEGIRDGKMISFKYFSDIVINVPSLPEQTKIANFLSAIDDKINHTQKQIDKAEVWKKGLMQQMFV